MWAITLKDLKLLLRDKRALSLLIALPLALVGIIGSASQHLVSPASDSGETIEPMRAYAVLVPAYTVMFTFFLVNVMARSIIQEREWGTLRRLRTAPITPYALLWGKTIPFWILSCAQGAVLFLAGRVLFGMPWGSSPWLLIPVLCSTSLAATALGLWVATIAKTESQVSAYSNFVVIVLAGVSGCLVPRGWLPEWLQTASLLTPHAWALMAYDQVLRSPVPQLGWLLACCGVLLVFTLFFFLGGRSRFHELR